MRSEVSADAYSAATSGFCGTGSSASSACRSVMSLRDRAMNSLALF